MLRRVAFTKEIPLVKTMVDFVVFLRFTVVTKALSNDRDLKLKLVVVNSYKLLARNHC